MAEKKENNGLQSGKEVQPSIGACLTTGDQKNECAAIALSGSEGDVESADIFETVDKQAVLDELEKNYWKTVGKRIKKDWRLYAMILPMVLVFLFWRYFPLYELIAAFKNNDAALRVWERNFVGLEYFYSLTVGVTSAEFWQAFRNTFLLSFYGLLYGFPVPIILALFFNEIKSNILRSGMQIAVYLPKFVSTVVVTTLIQMLLSKGSIFAEPGILAQFLERIGLVSQDDIMNGMLYTPKYFRAIYQVSGIWEAAGYGSIVFFAAIISIPPTSYEAARIDGASKMAQLWHVVIPGISSTIVIMLILRIGELLTVGYEKVLLLYNSEIYSTADIVSTFVFRKGGMDASTSGATNPSLASAADMIAAVISMLLVMGANLVSRKVSDTSLY